MKTKFIMKKSEYGGYIIRERELEERGFADRIATINPGVDSEKYAKIFVDALNMADMNKDGDLFNQLASIVNPNFKLPYDK